MYIEYIDIRNRIYLLISTSLSSNQLQRIDIFVCYCSWLPVSLVLVLLYIRKLSETKPDFSSIRLK